MSIIKDPGLRRYEKVILTHGVRWVSELGYHDYHQRTADNEWFRRHRA